MAIQTPVQVIRKLTPDDVEWHTITLDPIVPGFAVKVSELFR